MADHTENTPVKTVRFRRRIHLNIGIIVFAVILIYFAINIIHYAVTRHTVAYEVQMGEITDSNTHTGLALRTEKITKAKSSGNLNYYCKEGDKVATDDNVCSIDSKGDISGKITQAGSDISALDDLELSNIRKSISAFSTAYTDDAFGDVYAFKSDINATIREELYEGALESYAEDMELAKNSGTFSFVSASEPGIVEYYIDGYESKTVDSFQEEDYAPSSYQATSLKELETASAGDELYKLVTDENWNLIVPITEEEEERYSEYDVIQVTFQKDERSCYVNFEIKEVGKNPYLILSLNSSMVRYASDRYVDVTLDINTSRGLKIPESAILEKSFILVPEEYVTRGNNSNQQGVLLQKGGSKTPEFTPVSIYNNKDGYYYINTDALELNDQIQMPESDELYTLSETDSLQGVYNINKGYAVFRQVEILAQNKEYAIVKTGSNYGLSMYDHIALEGNSISEGELIK